MKQETFYPSPNGDENNGYRYLGAAWALVMCATLSTAVRTWVRGRLTRNMGVRRPDMTIMEDGLGVELTRIRSGMITI